MKRIVLLALLIYSLLFLGLAALQGQLIALALPLILYAAAIILHYPPMPQVAIYRTLGQRHARPDQPVTVRLSVKNLGENIEELTLRESLPPGLKLEEGDTSVIVGLPHGETFEWSYTVSGARGAYDFGDVDIDATERLGIIHRRTRYVLRTQLLIVPEVRPLRSITVHPPRTRGYAGPILSRQGGSGTDFFGVREYQPGDPRQWINWRMSARHPRSLFTNEFEQERIADIGLILDARQRLNVERNGDSLFEHAIRATGALAEAFLNDGNRVALLIYGRGLERTFPGYGRHHRERILRALAQARTGDSIVFENLDYLPTRFFPAKSQVVLVSPLCEDDPPILSRLRARGYEVLVVSPDPISFESDGLPGDQITTTAARIARVERLLWVRSLQRLGIAVVDWDVHKPLDTAVHSTLHQGYRRSRR